MDINNICGHGVDRVCMDESVSPADDFYAYASGGWIAAHPLTGEYARYGLFDDLREKNRLQLRELVDSLSSHPDASTPGTVAQKINDLYRMGLDTARRDAEGMAPLCGQLARIAETPADGLIELIAWAHDGLTSSFFSSGVGADPKDSSMNILHVGEGGLGLGDRDYYLVRSEEHDRILDAYRSYITEVMTIAGYGEAEAARVRDNVMMIETELAGYKKTREERRNPLLAHNPRTLDELEREMPGIAWRRYFKALGLPEVESLNVGSLGYLQKLSAFLPTLSEQAVKDYITFQAIDAATGLLGDDLYEASFRMYDVTMSGIEEREPLWKRAIAVPGSMLGQALGQLYVEKYFPPEAKERMLVLVENLRKALGRRIEGAAWMSAATKARALEKLAAMTVKIGYPEKWKDYSGIHIDPSRSYLENVCEASRWYVRDNYSKLGKPVDRDEWLMHPQTVNAYYRPNTNDICFPAGILQPPYFDMHADDALNYGSIGVVIGHEMTHGFDDQGRRYDLSGNLSDWWTREDEAAFNRLADRLVAQFDAIEVAPGTHANGRFTLGENIADQGGLNVALTAYLASGSPGLGEKLDGFTAMQRFFIAYAQLWAESIRPEEVSVRVKSDPHSLGRQRVNATLRNITPFIEAFSLPSDCACALPEEERVQIW